MNNFLKLCTRYLANHKDEHRVLNRIDRDGNFTIWYDNGVVEKKNYIDFSKIELRQNFEDMSFIELCTMYVPNIEGGFYDINNLDFIEIHEIGVIKVHFKDGLVFGHSPKELREYLNTNKDSLNNKFKFVNMVNRGDFILSCLQYLSCINDGNRRIAIQIYIPDQVMKIFYESGEVEKYQKTEPVICKTEDVFSGRTTFSELCAWFTDNSLRFYRHQLKSLEIHENVDTLKLRLVNGAEKILHRNDLIEFICKNGRK